jgi:hypothetical protein
LNIVDRATIATLAGTAAETTANGATLAATADGSVVWKRRIEEATLALAAGRHSRVGGATLAAAASITSPAVTRTG